MRKIKLPMQESISKELIIDLIEKHQAEKDRILKLKEYYKNNNDIKNRTQSDSNKPNNLLSHGYARYITDSFCGYFLGRPVTYKSMNKNLLEQITNCFTYNDEVGNNISVAQEVSIGGYAYEIMYMDNESNLRFKGVNTDEMIVVYDNTIEEKIQFAIRYYDVYSLEDEEIKEVVLYTNNEVVLYSFKDDNLEEIERQTHYFNDVPVIDYDNNDNRLGDFEPVLSLIDAYDKTQSDTANDFEYFTNALLVVSGILINDDENESPLDFKNNRVLNFADGDSKAEYLIKNINDTALENYKDRLNNDIHRFSNVVNMSDENFGGNLTGIAIKHKLTGMEYVTGIKETKFRKGLMRRIELAVNVLNIKTNDVMLYTEINPVFTRNMPTNDEEITNIAKGLVGIVSDQTVLSMLPYIDDVQAEMEIKAKEREGSLDPYIINNNKTLDSNKEVDIDE